MKTVFWLKFTKSEIEHINSLINLNETEGSYTPPKQAYWNRSARIRKKLSDISKTCYMFQSPPNKHTSCMYCEKKLNIGEAIILCKQCTE